MCSELRRDLDFLAEEVRRLHTEWDCYEQLFLTRGRRILRGHAGHCLSVIAIALSTDVIMTICRLCDPVQSRNSKNGTNLVFARFLEGDLQPGNSILSRIRRLMKLYKTSIRPFRNKRLAHNGLMVLSITAPRVKAIKLAIRLCDEIVGGLFSTLTHTAISFPQSFVPGELDWIEAALRMVDEDRYQIKSRLEEVRRERMSA